jgi:hypothetical protein
MFLEKILRRKKSVKVTTPRYNGHVGIIIREPGAMCLCKL